MFIRVIGSILCTVTPPQTCLVWWQRPFLTSLIIVSDDEGREAPCTTNRGDSFFFFLGDCIATLDAGEFDREIFRGG